MKYMFKVIFNVSCWIQNYRYSKEFDAELNKLMDSEKFHTITQYTAKIGNLELWIANHPYASFTAWNGKECGKIRPSRRTIFKAMDKLNKDKSCQ